VGALKVSVDIAHPYIGDLRVMLTAPDNQRITLHSRKGGSADNINTTYDPAQVPDLAHLIGIGSQGEWSLIVVDEAARDVGTLRSWKLSINLAESDPYRGASQPGMQIPDNNPGGISDSVEIAGTGSVREVRVFVDITHTYVGDLRVALRSPSGREVTLHNRAGGPSDNLLRTYDATTAPDLASLVGESTAGLWTLRVSDLAGRDIGKLNRWELHVMP
jgi:subtilisin-like proprotein convertase family protein